MCVYNKVTTGFYNNSMKKQNADLQCHGRVEQETSKLCICHCSTLYFKRSNGSKKIFLFWSAIEQNCIYVLCVFHFCSEARPLQSGVSIRVLLRTTANRTEHKCGEMLCKKKQSESVHCDLPCALDLLSQMLMQASILPDERGIVVSKCIIKSCRVGQQNEPQIY